MKNPVIMGEHQMFIECTNVQPSQFVTASLEDADLLQEYRWRIINEVPVTTRLDDSGERVYTVDAVLFGLPRTSTLTRRDQNPLNIQRSNLNMSPTKRQNAIVAKGDYADLYLLDGTVAQIDAEDVARVATYTWTHMVYRGQSIILSRFRVDKEVRKVQLPRLIMNMDRSDTRTIVFLNGNRFDCRKANLTIAPH